MIVAGDSLSVTWTSVPVRLGQVRDEADPLGLRSVALRIARDLVPILTQSSWAVRGFGLLCLALDLAEGTDEPVRSFRRFDRLVLHAQCSHHVDDRQSMRGLGPYSGQRIAFTRLEQGRVVDLDRPVLRSSDLSGFWASYQRPAALLGLARRVGSLDPAGFRLTELGRQLSRATAAALVLDRAAIRRHLKADSAKVEVSALARVIAEDTGQPTTGELAALDAAVAGFDERRAVDGSLGPFAGLRAAYDDGGGQPLAAETMTARMLTPTQRLALEDARAVLHIFDQVERPFRTWMTGADTEFTVEVGDPYWQRAVTRGGPEIVALRNALVAAPSLDAVLRRHVQLSAERDREAWVRGDDRPLRREPMPLDFTLTTVSRLFASGVLGGRR